MLEKIGVLIRRARLEAGLTQKQVADRLDMSRSLISSIEHGLHNSRVETLNAIATILGMRLEIPPREDEVQRDG